MSTIVNSFYRKADLDVALQNLSDEIMNCEPSSSYAAQFLNNAKRQIQVVGLSPEALNKLYLNLQMSYSYDPKINQLLTTIAELFSCLKFRLYQASESICDANEAEKFLQLLDEFQDEKSLINGVNCGKFRQFANNEVINNILCDMIPQDSDYIKFYGCAGSPRFEYVNGDVRYVTANGIVYEIVNNVIDKCYACTQTTVLLKKLNSLLDEGYIKLTDSTIVFLDPMTETEYMIIDVNNATCSIKAFKGSWINFEPSQLGDVWNTLATMESLAMNNDQLFQVHTMRMLWSVYNDEETNLSINMDPQYIKVFETADQSLPNYVLLWCGKNVIDLTNYCEYESFDSFINAQDPMYCFC